jgi:hypothetical protein
VATGTPVSLTWTDNATNESYYLIEVSIDGGLTYQTLATVPGFAPVPTGKGIVNYAAAATLGVNNTYRVTAVVTDATGVEVLSSLPALVTANLTAPAAPATPVFTAATTKVNANGTVALNWGAVTGASGYLVAISSGGTAIAGSPFLITATNFAPALTLGSAYSITVTAQASRFPSALPSALTTNSAPSAAFVADLTAPAAPADPTNLTATLASLTTARLSWVDNASTETGYLIEVSTDGGVTYSTVTTVPRTGAQVAATAGTVRYTATVVAGTSNIYRVSALTARFGSPLTTTASGYATSAPFAVPAAPFNVVATSTANVPATVAAAPIIVSWTQTPSTGVTGFTVQRRTDTAGVLGAWSGNVAGCSVAASVFTCTITKGNTKGIGYQFQVKATTAVGNLVSLPSATVVAQ